jgi:hypothetical protein
MMLLKLGTPLPLLLKPLLTRLCSTLLPPKVPLIKLYSTLPPLSPQLTKLCSTPLPPNLTPTKP